MSSRMGYPKCPMSQTEPISPLADQPASKKPGLGPLLAILAAIVLGVLIGVLFGEPMWIAAQGPQRESARMQEIKDQKETLVAQLVSAADEQEVAGDAAGSAANRAEADRIRGHIPQIESRIEQVDGKIAEPTTLGTVLWELSDFVGDLFIQVLKLLVIPLVVTSMICGITSLGDVRRIGRLGGWTVGYYMSTGAVAVLIGILLVLVIQPGTSSDDTFFTRPTTSRRKRARR